MNPSIRTLYPIRMERNWPAHAGPYRWVDSMDTVWKSSPVIPDATDLAYFPYNPWIVHEETNYERDEREGRRSRKGCGLFWKSIQSLFGNKETVRWVEAGVGTPPKISAQAWKDYGYWARPTVNTVPVHNATPLLNPPRYIDPSATFDSLIGPHGSPHPERWIPRMRHPALPQRPNIPGWDTPDGAPLPFPAECALNPFLVHKTLGRPSIAFDLSLAPSSILYSEPGPDRTIPLSPADRAQPATCPLLTHMDIMYIADDTTCPFPWPIPIENPRGITVQDIFQALYVNFQQHVSGTEFNSWDERQQNIARSACWNRHIRDQFRSNWLRLPTTPVGPHLRRIDYLGDRIMFRGLEPAPAQERNGSAWILFLGP